MATAYGSNFDTLGQNLRAAEALQIQNTSNILSALNRTGQTAANATSNRERTAAERERTAAQERIATNQSEADLALGRETNELYRQQIQAEENARKAELDRQKETRGIALEVANANAARYQTIYSDSMAEAEKAALVASRANDERTRLNANKPEEKARIAQLDSIIKESSAIAAAATKQANNAKQTALSLAGDGFSFDDTGKKWQFIDRYKKPSMDTSAAPQQPPPGVTGFGGGGGGSTYSGPRFMPKSERFRPDNLPIGPVNQQQVVPIAPAPGVTALGLQPSRGPITNQAPLYQDTGINSLSPLSNRIYEQPKLAVSNIHWADLQRPQQPQAPQGGVSAFGQEPATLTGQAIQQGYFTPRIEPGGRIFFPNFEDVFPDGVSGGLRQPAFSDLPEYRFGSPESLLMLGY